MNNSPATILLQYRPRLKYLDLPIGSNIHYVDCYLDSSRQSLSLVTSFKLGPIITTTSQVYSIIYTTWPIYVHPYKLCWATVNQRVFLTDIGQPCSSTRFHKVSIQIDEYYILIKSPFDIQQVDWSIVINNRLIVFAWK